MVWLGETTRVEWDLWLSWKDTSKRKKKRNQSWDNANTIRKERLHWEYLASTLCHLMDKHGFVAAYEEKHTWMRLWFVIIHKKKPGIRKKINMNEAKLLLDMVGQKLVSKERFPITQKTGLCLLLSSNLILFSLMDTGQGYRIRMFYLRV